MKRIATFFLIIFLPSCFPARIHSSYTDLGSANVQVQPETVYIFFAGEPINFSYSKVGLIEVSSDNIMDTDSDLLDRLRLVAADHFANAVISVKKERVEQIRGSGKDLYSVNRLKMSGIAISVKEDSAFNFRYAATGNSDFRRKAKAYKEDAKRKSEGASAFITVFALLLIVAVIIVKSDEK